MKPRHLLLFIVLSIALFACSDEAAVTPATPPGSVPEGYMAVEIVLPALSESAPATRALSATQECEVQTIDVLAFNAADNKYVFHEVATDIADHPSAVDGDKKIFYVKIPTGVSYTSIYLMLIANAHDAVEDAKSAGYITTAKTKAEVVEKLTFIVPTYTDALNGLTNIWPVQPGPHARFPMWGESAAVDLTATTITIAPVDLLRAVARIDVGVNFNSSDVPQDLTPTFTLDKVYVYNAHNQLLVAPTAANYNAATKVVTAPSIPTGAGAVATIESTLRSYNSDKLAHTHEIYVAEHAKGDFPGGQYAQNLCLVIAGNYNNTGTTYYRVDFIKTIRDGGGNVTSQDFLPILRNHRYRVNITTVHGPGHTSPALAFAATGLNSNLAVEITDTNEELTEFVYDGQYALGVGKGEFILDKNLHTGVELPVHTTYTNWTAAVAASDNWITLTTAAGSTGMSTLKFNTSANIGAERTGYITITSGRMEKKIKVTQRNIGFIEISGKEDWYVMEYSRDHTFAVKSTYDWQVKIKNDNYNILKSFTTSGTANLTGTAFNFKMENDIAYQTILDQTATLTFYSLTGEFADFDVTIRGVSLFDLGDVYVYPKDQPTGGSWYPYSNTPPGLNENSVPPSSGTQSNPPMVRSCASLVPQVPGKPWRLPTQAELGKIYTAASTGGAVTRYGFSTGGYFSATTSSMGISYVYLVYFNNGSQSGYGSKTSENPARCVRNK